MGRTEKLIAVAGISSGLGGGAMMAVASQVFPKLVSVFFWGGAALVLFGLGLAFWGLFHKPGIRPTKPFAKPAEIEGPRLRGGYLLKPDATIREALDFVVTGSWDGAGHDGPSYLAALGKALQDFHQIAANGQLRVWYKSYKDGVWEVLRPSAFKAHKIEILDLLNDGELVMRRRRDGTVIETCNELRVNRDQIEDAWPVYSALLSR